MFTIFSNVTPCSLADIYERLTAVFFELQCSSNMKWL